MATLAELMAERERRAQQAPTEFGQQVEAATAAPAIAPTVDGVPEPNALPVSQRPGGTTTSLAALKAEKARREAAQVVDARIATDPVPTGQREIDLAGQEVTPRLTGAVGIGTPRDVPALEDREFDDPVRIKAARAAEGVDYNSGLPFIQRLKVATLPQNRELRAKGMQRVLGENFAQVPDDMPKFRYDPSLDNFEVLMPQENGQFRWTSLDGSGVEAGDLGDMFNLAEIGSLAGSALGAGKYLTFWKGAGTTAGLGLVGRELGEGTSILINYLQSGDKPTIDSLKRQGWSDVGIEALSGVFGELGAKLLRGTSNTVQTTAAEVQGKQSVSGLTGKQVDEANLNIRETQEDMRRVRAVTGEELPVTQGTASHSIPIIEGEAFALKKASSKTRREFERQMVEGRRTTQNYIDQAFGGNPRFLGDAEGVVQRANDVLGTAGKMTIAQTDDGIIHVVPKLDPEGGVKLRSEPEFWQVRGTKLDESVQGFGLGQDMYTATSAEARRHGKILASDTQVSEDALEGIWKKLDGSGDFENLIWNKNVETFTDGSGRSWLRSTDGLPVVQQQPLPATTADLIANFTKPGRSASGKIVATKEMSRFLRSPLPEELGVVLKDIEVNPIARHQMKQAIFADYERSVVGKNGEFSIKRFEEWKEDVGKVAEKIFTAEEMQAIRVPGKFRPVMDAATGSMEARLSAVQKIMKTDRATLLDPSQRPMWNQLKKLSPADRRRTMRILDSMDAGRGIRELFKDELKNTLRVKGKGTASESYQKWFDQHSKMILDITGDTEYLNAMRTVGNILKRRSDRGMVRGSAPEVNPSAIALTRVIFGPLSRAQRFISAATRTGQRSTAASSADIITDPAALKELMAIRTFPVASRRVTQFILKTGLLEPLGIDPDTFNAEDADDRQRLADQVNALLAEDVSNVE
jgi:hypothetical protein